MKARILTIDGWRNARCIWRKRGLAVTESYGVPGWTLTVVGQGRSIGSLTTGIANPHKAKAMAAVLVSAVDWSRVRDPIPGEHREPLGEFVRAVLEMFEVIPS